MITPKLVSKSQGTTQFVSIVNGELQMARDVYQLLGSLVKNRTIASDYDLGTLDIAYVNFLDRMDILLQYIRLANSGLPVTVPDLDIVEIDEYLGDLGVIQEYSYGKDRISIAPWLEYTESTAIRPLMVHNADGAPTHYLTANNNTEILVRYK